MRYWVATQPQEYKELGKPVSLKEYTNSQNFHDHAKPFNGSEDMKEITADSNKSLIILCVVKYGEGFDNVRYSKFCQKVW